MEKADKADAPTPAPRKSTSNIFAEENFTISPPFQCRHLFPTDEAVSCEDVEDPTRLGSRPEKMDNLPQVSVTRSEKLLACVECEPGTVQNVVRRRSCQKNGKLTSRKKKPAPPPPTFSEDKDTKETHNPKLGPSIDSPANQIQADSSEITAKILKSPVSSTDVKPSLGDAIALAPFPRTSNLHTHATTKILPQNTNNTEFLRQKASPLELCTIAQMQKELVNEWEQASVSSDVPNTSKTLEEMTKTAEDHYRISRPPRPPAPRRLAPTPPKSEDFTVQQEYVDICDMNGDTEKVFPKCAHASYQENLPFDNHRKDVLAGAFGFEQSAKELREIPVPKPRRKKRTDGLEQSSLRTRPNEFEQSSLQIGTGEVEQGPLETSPPMLTDEKDSMVIVAGVVTELVWQVKAQIDTGYQEMGLSEGEQDRMDMTSEQGTEFNEEDVENRHEGVCDHVSCGTIETIRL